MDSQLQALAQSQGRWSATANSLKSRYQNARKLSFGMAISGALLATVASQLENPLRQWLAIASTVLFAIVSFLAARRLGAEQTMAWVRARAAAESLKREAYTYAALAAPYDDPATRSARLRSAVQQIEAGVDDLLGDAVAADPGSTPIEPLTPQAYLERRVKRQIEQFYEPKALACQATTRKLRGAEFVLALLTTCTTAVFGSLDKWPTTNAPFDVMALTAVLTTISGMILSHIEASRYDYLVVSYRATARRLRDALLNAPADAVAPSPAWSACVTQCEAILGDENSAWVAKLGKPGPAVTASAGAPADAPAGAPAVAPALVPDDAAAGLPGDMRAPAPGNGAAEIPGPTSGNGAAEIPGPTSGNGAAEIPGPTFGNIAAKRPADAAPPVPAADLAVHP